MKYTREYLEAEAEYCRKEEQAFHADRSEINRFNVLDKRAEFANRYEACVTDREMIVFLMDEIDKASQWLIEGQTHMATGVLGQCHAEIRKHLSKSHT